MEIGSILTVAMGVVVTIMALGPSGAGILGRTMVRVIRVIGPVGTILFAACSVAIGYMISVKRK
jgi:hypothetical protein